MKYHIIFKLSEEVVEKISRKERNEFVYGVTRILANMCGPYEKTGCSYKISFNHDFYSHNVSELEDIRSFEIELDKDDHCEEMIDFVRKLYVEGTKHQIFYEIVYKGYKGFYSFKKVYHSKYYIRKAKCLYKMF